MKKKIVILVLLFLSLVIYFAPVKVVENFIPQNNKLSILGMKGSVWSGNIDRVVVSDWLLEDLDYHLNFFSLLTGNLNVSTLIKKGDIRGELDFDISDINNLEISEANLQAPAIRLEKYLPFPGIELGGNLSVQDLTMQLINQKPTTLFGTTRWKKANVDINGKSWALGDFEVIWHMDNGVVVGNVSKSVKNQLGLEGTVTLTTAGLLEFKGSIASSTDQSIYAALSLFANGTMKNGRLPIKLKRKIL